MTGKRVQYQVHLVREAHGRVSLRRGRAPEPPPPSPAISRLARLVALSHHLEGLVRSGAVADYAGVARLAGVSRARVSQIIDLQLLAPDIQEAVLFMERPARGRAPIGEQHLRPIVRIPGWDAQRRAFRALLDRRTG